MLFLVFLFGLFIGSFLNVLIDRVPKEESVVLGRSYCDSCKKKLRWFDLIPVLSFIFLGGKCRYCHSPLSSYYPLVEIITGFMFVLVFIFLSNGIKNYELRIMNVIDLIYYCFIISSLIVVFFTDLKYGIIPDKILYPAILISLVYIILNTKYLILSHLLSAVGAFLFFLLLYLITRGKGMGFGDIKLSFLMGFILGLPAIIFALYIAFLTGAIVGVILVLWGKKKLKGAIPFGPFLVLGTILSIFLEETLIKLLHWLNFW